MAAATTTVLDRGLLVLIEAAVVQALLVVMSEEQGLDEKHDWDTDDGNGSEDELESMLASEEAGLWGCQTGGKEHVDNDGQDGWGSLSYC